MPNEPNRFFDKQKTVFISGSAYEYGTFGESGQIFIRDLTKSLLRQNFKVISGFGMGVGNHVIEGALTEIYLEKKERASEHLQVYPFPVLWEQAGTVLQEQAGTIHQLYRDEMLSSAGIAIFLFGNKLEDICIREADGMWKEFEIARSNQALLIPVGASGYAAGKMWRWLIEQYDSYFNDRKSFPLFERLGNPTLSPDTLIDTILRIVKNETETYIHQL